eukprot:6194537-Pleurochrysis_carterae.AAC.1
MQRTDARYRYEPGGTAGVRGPEGTAAIAAATAAARGMAAATAAGRAVGVTEEEATAERP